MKHEHKEIKDCEHKKIEHCKKCDVVECLECGKEWKVEQITWVGETTMLPYQDGTNGVINLCKYD